jgi:hypothetical protein
VHGTAGALKAIQEELPERTWPVPLGVGGLVLIGAIEWPVAIGATALYVAFKHWRPRHA